MMLQRAKERAPDYKGDTTSWLHDFMATGRSRCETVKTNIAHPIVKRRIKQQVKRRMADIGVADGEVLPRGWSRMTSRRPIRSCSSRSSGATVRPQVRTCSPNSFAERARRPSCRRKNGSQEISVLIASLASAG